MVVVILPMIYQFTIVCQRAAYYECSENNTRGGLYDLAPRRHHRPMPRSSVLNLLAEGPQIGDDCLLIVSYTFLLLLFPLSACLSLSLYSSLSLSYLPVCLILSSSCMVMSWLWNLIVDSLERNSPEYMQGTLRTCPSFPEVYTTSSYHLAAIINQYVVLRHRLRVKSKS